MPHLKHVEPLGSPCRTRRGLLSHAVDVDCGVPRAAYLFRGDVRALEVDQAPALEVEGRALEAFKSGWHLSGTFPNLRLKSGWHLSGTCAVEGVIVELHTPQDGALQVSVAEVVAHDVGDVNAGPGEIGPGKLAVGDGGQSELAAAEVGPAQVAAFAFAGGEQIRQVGAVAGRRGYRVERAQDEREMDRDESSHRG